MKAKKNNVARPVPAHSVRIAKNYLTEDGYTYWRWDEDLKKGSPRYISVLARNTPTRTARSAPSTVKF